MYQNKKTFIALGSMNAALCIILGAFAKHSLHSKLSAQMLSTYATAVQYHFYHALGLILVGLLLEASPANRLLKGSGWIMFAGIMLFSGSLYLLVFSNTPRLGMITPLGGVCFIVSWILLALAALRDH